MKSLTLSSPGILLLAFALAASGSAYSQQDDPNVDRAVFVPNFSPTPRTNNDILVITTPDGYDNFDIGVDFAEPHMSSHVNNPLWYFNAFNVTTSIGSNSHNTINGHDWTTTNPSWPTVMRGDPVTAYDSLGNLYFEQMYGSPNILGTYIAKSTDNGQTWASVVLGNTGNDKNWMAADQTMGPYANYVYATMTPGNVVRSTNQGASFQFVASMTNTLPGMMVAVGPNVLGGNNIPGGAVYVVTNTGSSTAATFTFYVSTNGGTSFQVKSAQNFANYVGTFVNGRNSVNNMRTRPYPFIAADNSYGPFRGRLYLVYTSNVPAGNGNKPDIFCRYSTDQGTTWSGPVTINDDPSSVNNHQWFPSIWCDKETGRLWVKWLDTRDTPTSDSCDVYASYSDNGGITWAPNQRITNRKFRINCTTCGGGGTPAYLGDYDAITSNAQGSLMVWTDFRNGNFGNMVAYFPDYAMLVSPSADTIGVIDSINAVVRVPSVKLYTRSVKFSATVSPAANITLSFPQRDSLTSYPDSLTLKIRTNNVPPGVYTVTVTGRGPNGTPIHRRTITLNVTNAFVALQQPNGGEQIFGGTSYPIMWGKYLVDTVRIEYSTNNGASWLLVTPGTPARPAEYIHPKLQVKAIDDEIESTEMATFNWVVPNTPSTSALVRIMSKSNPSIADTSDATFTILATPAPRWTTQSSPVGVALYSVSVVDTSRAWAAGDSGRVVRTVNGGASWVTSGNVTNPVYNIYAIDATRALAAVNGGGSARIMRTITSGLTWQTVYQDNNPAAFINAIKMFDAQNGYAMGDPVNGQWTLLRTTDGGATWTPSAVLVQAGTEAGWNNSMAWIGNQNGWFGTNNSRVYRTTTGGTSWSFAPTPFVNSYAVGFASQSTGMAGGTGLARSVDGGASWSATPAQQQMFALVGVDVTPARFYGVSGSSVYKTTDHGTTLQVDHTGPAPYNHIDMKVVPIGGNNWVTGYAVGNGTITKYHELLTVTGSPEDGGQIPTEFALHQNYPNPFNPKTSFRFEVPSSMLVTLRVYDMLGREVATLVNEMKEPGVYEVNWDASHVASGVYFYKMHAGSFTEIKKLMLLK